MEAMMGKNEYELERVNNKNLAFERLWNNVDENVNVMDFVEVKDEIIARYQKADFSFRRNCFCEVHWEQSSACSEPKASSDNTSSD